MFNAKHKTSIVSENRKHILSVKAIAGFDNNYFISENGVITRTQREIVNSKGVKCRLPAKTMKPRCGKKYPHLFVDLHFNQKRFTKYIHKVVAETFLPKPSEKHIYVRHIDGNYSNNHISNLEWITNKELQLNYQITRNKTNSI